MHLTEADIILYLENRTGADERAAMEAHIGDCAECANQFAAVAQLQHVLAEETPLSIDAHTQRRVERLVPAQRTRVPFLQLFRPPARMAFAVISVAAIGIVAYFSLRESPDSVPSQFRSTESDEGIAVVYPPDGVVLEKGAVLFRWRYASDEGYRFQLMDEAGKPLWTAFVPDTFVTLPSHVVIVEGKSYLWSVQSPLGTRSKRHVFRYGSPP